MIDKKEAFKIIENALSNCNYYTMITINEQYSGVTRFANSEICQNMIVSDIELTIDVYDRGRKSSVTTNILDKEEIKIKVKECESNLQFYNSTLGEFNELTDKNEIVSDNYNKRLENIFDVTNRAKVIRKCIELLDMNYSAGGALTLSKQVLAMGNNRGTRRYGRIDKINFNAVVTHNKGSAGYIEFSTDNEKDFDILTEFNNAYRKAQIGINPVSLKSGEYTVILEPLAVGDLLTYMNYYGFSAKSVQSGRSFLTEKKGRKVFSDKITIIDDVNDSNTFYFPFDFEGYKRKPVKIITDGLATDLLYDLESSNVDGVETTGHSFGNSNIGGFGANLVMKGGDSNLDRMIKTLSSGIIISRFHYIDVIDPRKAVFSALIRDSAFLIQNGIVTKGIKNMRFTDSIINIFNNVLEISSERRKVQSFLGVNFVPAIKIEKFNLTHLSG